MIETLDIQSGGMEMSSGAKIARTRNSIRLAIGAATVGAVALAEVPAQAAAPPPAQRSLVVGESVASQIDAGDPVVAGQYTETYALRLNAGDRVRIDMDAVAAGGTQPLDTYLRIYGPDDAQLSYNDDRGDGTFNSRLIFEAPAPGSYRIAAQGFGNRTGAYTIVAAALPAAPPAETVTPGQHAVLLNDAAGVEEVFGTLFRYRDFEFAGAEGDRIYLQLLPAAAPAPAVPAAQTSALADAVRVDMVMSEGGRDVASAGGLPGFENPRMLVVLPRPGTYRVRVRSPISGDKRFTLGLEQQPANISAASPRLLPRTTTNVAERLRLTSDVVSNADDATAVGSLADTYAIPVRSGERVIVTLSSTDFDPVLDAGTVSLLGYAVAVSNNDGGQGLNSRLELMPERGGIIQLRVRSTVPALGSYDLRIERSNASPRPSPRPTAPAPAPVTPPPAG